MSEQVYITNDCIIQNNQVWLNNQLVFEQQGLNAADFFEAAYRSQQSDYPKFFKMDKLSQMGTVAAGFLLGSQVDKEKYPPTKTGIVLSNSNASLDADIQYYKSVATIPSPALFVYTLPNIVIGEISIRYGFKGENAFFVSQRPDADLLHFYVSDLFNRGVIDACLTGWVEVLGENYEARICWVEKEKKKDSIIFSKENIHQLYQRSWKN